MFDTLPVRPTVKETHLPSFGATPKQAKRARRPPAQDGAEDGASPGTAKRCGTASMLDPRPTPTVDRLCPRHPPAPACGSSAMPRQNSAPFLLQHSVNMRCWFRPHRLKACGRVCALYRDHLFVRYLLGALEISVRSRSLAGAQLKQAWADAVSL